MASAGYAYTYASRSLGKSAGFVAGWLYAFGGDVLRADDDGRRRLPDVLAWLVVGIATVAVLHARRPDAIGRIGSVLGEDASAELT
jgi:hypothetical protein